MSLNRKIGERESRTTQLGHSHARAGLQTALLAARNHDGGWAYAPGRRSRIEPTCWAALALGHSEGQTPDVDALGAWKRQDAWLIDVAGAPPNTAFNALAALTFLQVPFTAALTQPIMRRLVETKGLSFGQNDVVRQDGSLQAWPWVDGTASWVEPTAWCLLLLKKLRSQAPSVEADERIKVGEQFLFDRACHDGGWNYGNKEVYGAKLWPYVPTTALALLAMRDHRNHPVVTRSLEQLQKDVASERSVVAVALTIICLRAYGVDTSALEQIVIELSAQAGRENILGVAMTLYALTDANRQVAFTV
jgi:hypothetical protein